MNKENEGAAYRVPKPLEAYRTDLKDREFKVVLNFQFKDGTFSAMRERLALNWLLQEQSEGSLLDQFKKYSLCMDLAAERSHILSFSTNSAFSVLDKKDQEAVKKLKENEELVNVVLHSIFRWFGTNVGRENLVSLAKVLDNDDLLKDLYDHWDGRQILCPRCRTGTGKIFKETANDFQFTCVGHGCHIDFYRDGTQPGTWYGGMILHKLPLEKKKTG